MLGFFKYLFLAELNLSYSTQALHCDTRASLELWYTGFRACGLFGLQHTDSLGEALGLSCSVACGILVTRPGIEPMSPALEVRFLATEPPGMSLGAKVVLSG